MSRILLSGFGPFPGVECNPSERLVRALAEGPAGAGLATRVLPTVFAAAADELVEAIEAERPAAVVMLGVAGPGPIRLERRARNGSRPDRPDAAGRCQPPGPILEGAPASYGSTLPLGALFRALEAAAVAVGWSDDAGGYVCNDLFFRIRHAVEQRLGEQRLGELPCGFLHVPPAAEADGEGRLTPATLARAGAAVLEALAARLAAPAPWRVEAGPADFRDWPALLALIRRSFAGQEGRIDPPSSVRALDVASLAEKAAHERLLLVRDAGGAPLACAFLRLGAAAPGAPAYLGKIAVEPALQGRGLGRALVAEALRLATAAGCRALELQTRIELTDNHRVFAALGFQRGADTAYPGYARPTSLTFRRDLP
ncbi:MAG: GNAT family N-acetyltransferase [Tistlia sp.]|uniref:GNAT family N-acetyltransferase n=1 Tax=Tistlia sp. TaxID=3057121 RepID=UPI0034A21A7B